MTTEFLQTLKKTNFDWTLRVDNVWHKPLCNVPSLHQNIKTRILDELEILKDRPEYSPLSLPITGRAGAGKTHLLTDLRQQALEQGANFVLIDMTDVDNFWETVRQGFITSIHKTSRTGQLQYIYLLDYFFNHYLGHKKIANPTEQFADFPLDKQLNFINTVLQKLGKEYPIEYRKHRDTLKALFLFASNDNETCEAAYSWLNGGDIDTNEQQVLTIRSSSGDAKMVISALSWLFSLAGPTLLAFDQLDAIVNEHHTAAGEDDDPEQLSNEQRVSLSIIEGISGGFMGIWDKLQRTQIVLSCLTKTWEILLNRGLQSAADRFRPAFMLKSLTDQEIARDIIYQRMDESYEKSGATPPYRGYPFSPESFDRAAGLTPRQILKACDQHKEICLAENKVTNFQGFNGIIIKPPIIDPIIIAKVQQRFEELHQKANSQTLKNKLTDNDFMVGMLQSACRCLLLEQELPDEVDGIVDQEFSSSKTYETLHSRVRLIYHNDNDRERHYSFRALQTRNARAFQVRLQAAIVASGINPNLPFRRLVILRTTPIPGGKVTAEKMDSLISAGGVTHCPTNDELRDLYAIYHLEIENPDGFESWLKKNKPMRELPIFHQARLSRKRDPQSDNETDQENTAANIDEIEKNDKQAKTPTTPKPGINDAVKEPKDQSPEPRQQQPGEILLGRRLINKTNGETITLPLSDLTRHTVIFAGSGSGKTVLIRRLVEEAALAGIPSLVLDGANDLSQLGTPWPETPDEWSESDKEQASRYHEQVETIVWTPGREKGNPLILNPIPDLSAVMDDPDELNLAISMTSQGLRQIVAPGSPTSVRNKNKIGLLSSSLRFFTKQKMSTLDDLMDLLSDLPPDASGGIDNAEKLAREMASLLRAETQTNTLLSQSGTALDPNILFGNDDKTRISVINLIGLPGLIVQQQFISQLAMTLFTWIKANPAKNKYGIRGLLVIDEAKDFVPSNGTPSSKEPILRLAAQARKYGLGLILASQGPKSIDHNIVANCTTQIYGKTNSPTALKTVQDMLQDKGGSGKDVARLKIGQFFLTNEKHNVPIKIQTPLCLSHHPSTPPEENSVLASAQKSRDLLKE
ncbi:MAG: DUF87 domain-containing protein [Desulfobulbaceae bacterium]|nr:DUF87 domain-containing protein [Desulfobulbaceae bacterium]